MDILKPFILKNGQFRGAFVAADEAVRQMLANHAYPDFINQAMAAVAVFGLFVASRVKYPGNFSIQIKADGIIKMILIEVSNELQIKGFAHFEADRASDDFKKLFGSGQLMFSVPMTNGEPYQGVIELRNSWTDTFADYFKMSEQIPTTFVMRQKNDQTRAIFVQQMPGKDGVSQEELVDDFETIHILLNSVRDSELFSDLAVNDVLFRLFHAHGLTVLEDKKPSFFCACYPGKFKTALKQFAPDQLEDAFEDGALTAQCEFCNQKYNFTRKDLE